MRWMAVGIAWTLGGCSSFGDLITSYSGTFSALNAGFTADQTLELDLAKDFRRKSEQLEFISRDTYSCGYAADRQRIENLVNPPKNEKKTQKEDKFAKDTLNKLRKKLHQLDAIIGYGEALANVKKESVSFQSYVDKASNAVKTYNSLAATPQSKLLQDAILGALDLLTQANKYANDLQVYRAAVAMNKDLKTNVDEIKRDKLPLLTEDEVIIFELWNSCAHERLTYIRDTFPSGPELKKMDKKPYLHGTARTPVLDFASAYGAYIVEREGFLARRPDYSHLLDAIVAANTKVVESAGDASGVLQGIQAAGDAAVNVNSKTEGIRHAVEAYNKPSKH